MSKFIEKIESIPAEATYALRHHILRPQQTLAECAYPADKNASSYHVGYYLNGKLVGVGSVLQESRDGTTGENAWRVRGMAVAEEVRDRGIGGKLLRALIAYATAQGLPGEIWCNGRVSAKSFYERAGFVQVGDAFDLPHIGPHMLFSRALR